MYLDTHKLTEEVSWNITHDKTAEHVFTVKAKLGDWTQTTLCFTLKEAETLVDQLGFAIQDFKGGKNGKV